MVEIKAEQLDSDSETEKEAADYTIPPLPSADTPTCSSSSSTAAPSGARSAWAAGVNWTPGGPSQRGAKAVETNYSGIGKFMALFQAKPALLYYDLNTVSGNLSAT